MKNYRKVLFYVIFWCKIYIPVEIQGLLLCVLYILCNGKLELKILKYVL